MSFNVDAKVEYTAASAENEYTAKIAVTHKEITKTYTVQFVRYNLALSANGATVESSSSYSLQPASNAIDGNYNTKWGSSQNTSDTYIEITLPDTAKIDSIIIWEAFSTKDTWWANSAITYSIDGETWTAVSATRTDDASQSVRKRSYQLTVPIYAKYVKYTAPEPAKITLNEIEVYGKNITEEYTTNCVISENKLVGNVVYLNKTQASVNDKYYLMAVYVDNAIYEVIPVNKSENTIATGVAANTTLTSSTLPESGTVTAKLFVWDTPGTLVPVIEPLTLR